MLRSASHRQRRENLDQFVGPNSSYPNVRHRPRPRVEERDLERPVSHVTLLPDELPPIRSLNNTMADPPGCHDPLPSSLGVSFTLSTSLGLEDATDFVAGSSTRVGCESTNSYVVEYVERNV
jgi:hypothetical protein